MAAITMPFKIKKKAEKKDVPEVAAMKGSGANCLVAQGTRLQGDFFSTESIRLDGAVIGTVKCERRLVVGKTGKVEGPVTAADAVVMGHIKGEVTATDAVVMGHIMGDVRVKGTLHLMGTAKIEGDIYASIMKVEEGAKYLGKCDISGK